MVQITDFLNYRSLCALTASPDGQRLGFVVQQPELARNGYKKELWVYDIAQASCKKLVDELERAWFLWQSNSELLVHGKAASGSSFVLVSADTAASRPAFSLEVAASRLEKLTDSCYALVAPYQNPEQPYPDQLAFLKESDSEFIIIDELPYWSNGVGYTNKRRNRLYTYDSAAGALQPVSPPLMEVSSFLPTVSGLLYIGTTFRDKKGAPGLYLYHPQTGVSDCLVAEGRYRIAYANYLDGQLYLIAADSQTALMTDNPKLYRLTASGELALALDADMSFTGTVLTDCKYGSDECYRVADNRLYFISTEGSSSFLRRVDSRMQLETLTADNGSVEGFALTPHGIFFSGLRGIRLQELYRQEAAGERQCSSFNEQVVNPDKANRPEKMSFENGGFTVNYVVLKPADFDPAKKYPAILFIHGGAKTLYTDVFFHEMQFLASKGYFVVYGNPRGSDGQGSLFARLQGNYGKPDYADLMKAMDTALERYPQIDKERLAVAGGSYGGIMTNWTVGHTDRFKCACAQRSISSMLTAFGAADNGFNFVREQMNADPWSNLDLLWEQSPLKYADRVKTPLLLIHADEDYRCHYVEAMQMFTALRYHGVESRICLIKGENHDLSRTGRPVQRIKRMYEIASWFDKYLAE